MLKDFCKTHLIIALDVMDILEAVKIASAVSSYVDAIKIGIPLGLVAGYGIFQRLKEETGLPIIADVKIADVPHIAREIARICFDAGADAVTVHGFVGPSSIEACVAEAGSSKDVTVMTEITHPDASLFMEDVSQVIARLAKDTGASGIQAPGNRPERVRIMRKIVGNEMTIISCGMGFQGGKRGSALRAGADFEIYGRSIYKAPNPEKAAKEISIALSRF